MPGKRPPRPFKLREEMFIAYLAPTVTAGISGLATHQSALAIAAPTSIGLTSAVVAAITGAILQRRGTARRSRRRLPTALAAGLTAGAIAAAVGLPASVLLPRLRIDLPVAAVLAATIITWRWHGSASARPAAAHRSTTPTRKDFA